MEKEKKKYALGKRKYVLSGIACLIVFTYILRLFTLQLLSEDYKADAIIMPFSSAFSSLLAEQLQIETVSCWCTTSQPMISWWL